MKYRLATVLVTLSIAVTPVLSEDFPKECEGISSIMTNMENAMNTLNHSEYCRNAKSYEYFAPKCINALYDIGTYAAIKAGRNLEDNITQTKKAIIDLNQRGVSCIP